MGKYTAKLIILWFDYFDENHTPLQRNGWHDFHSKKSNFIIQYGRCVYRTGATVCIFCKLQMSTQNSG